MFGGILNNVFGSVLIFDTVDYMKLVMLPLVCGYTIGNNKPPSYSKDKDG